MPQDSWKAEGVASQQYELAKTELEKDPSEVAPYKYFLQALSEAGVESANTILDIGCGVGQYAVLCLFYFPHLHYHGVDFSPEAIQYARALAPFARFTVKDVSDAYICGDIIMTASSIEYTDDPWETLRTILESFTSVYIMHRVRICQEKSHHFEEDIYAGQRAMHFAWNLQELEAFITKFDLDHTVISWEQGNQVTIVIKRSGNGLGK